MNLYNLTLQQPTAITCAVTGRFTSDTETEILLVRERILEILRVDKNGLLKTVALTNVFGIIRDVHLFRMIGLSIFIVITIPEICILFFILGQKRDNIMIGSDSGTMTILEYDTRKERLIPLFNEFHGISVS